MFICHIVCFYIDLPQAPKGDVKLPSSLKYSFFDFYFFKVKLNSKQILHAYCFDNKQLFLQKEINLIAITD